MKSLLRWAGSKRAMLHHLRGYWVGGRRYIEPFCGSACLFFDLEPPQALLGDLNGELIFTLRAIRNVPQAVVEALRRLRTGRVAYYHARATPPASLAEGDRAARFVYLNRNCFNGIYRTNAAGNFNVPYGPPKSGYGVDEQQIFDASKALQSASLIHGDFEETLSNVQRGDFVYLDPPYFLEGRRVFREYGCGAFGERDLGRLSAQLARLDRRGAQFVITYADSTEAREMLRPWSARRVRVRRHIAGFSHHRRHAYELIATNSLLYREAHAHAHSSP